MKTELPKDWYITINSQKEFDIFLRWSVDNHYFDQHHLRANAYQFPYFCGLKNTNTWYHREVKEEFGADEITIEEFEHLVLNKSTEPQYEIY